MKNNSIQEQENARDEVVSLIDALVREGARKMLQAALEEEVSEYVERHKGRRDEEGRQLVVRNGHKEERAILTGAGPLRIRQPRVDDRKLTKKKMVLGLQYYGIEYLLEN